MRTFLYSLPFLLVLISSSAGTPEGAGAQAGKGNETVELPNNCTDAHRLSAPPGCKIRAISCPNPAIYDEKGRSVISFEYSCGDYLWGVSNSSGTCAGYGPLGTTTPTKCVVGNVALTAGALVSFTYVAPVLTTTTTTTTTLPMVKSSSFWGLWTTTKAGAATQASSTAFGMGASTVIPAGKYTTAQLVSSSLLGFSQVNLVTSVVVTHATSGSMYAFAAASTGILGSIATSAKCGCSKGYDHPEVRDKILHLSEQAKKLREEEEREAQRRSDEEREAQRRLEEEREAQRRLKQEEDRILGQQLEQLRIQEERRALTAWSTEIVLVCFASWISRHRRNQRFRKIRLERALAVVEGHRRRAELDNQLIDAFRLSSPSQNDDHDRQVALALATRDDEVALRLSEGTTSSTTAGNYDDVRGALLAAEALRLTQEQAIQIAAKLQVICDRLSSDHNPDNVIPSSQPSSSWTGSTTLRSDLVSESLDEDADALTAQTQHNIPPNHEQSH